ncbi:group 3 secretory phospholipase A2 isoform X1 [Amblyraja radiata]|uniref:group 3 secretory phospholipase A2 isoform X1 n=1 Tax=Amblyraja radiata TaxID=386614 RepID=UPI001402C365|nr:group 3 secretory phospholipase A2 isoform X1 [Amblyraja radiata]
MFLAGCLLYLLSVPPAAASLSPGERTLCHLVSGDRAVRSLTFLARLGGGPGRLVLFHTLWSGRGLERCTVQSGFLITRHYLAFCLERRHRPGPEGEKEKEGRFLRVGEPESRLRILQQLAAARCRLTVTPGSPRRRERAATRRHRRSWTVPGTIWCGAGDTAEKFSDLGRFDQTDFCCREHDHCERKIAAFEYKYGTLNIRLHTVSHCDCDDRFKKCLLGVNNTISKMVGLTFFNLLKVPCFSLEPVKHCVKKSWLSSCQVTEAAPKAIFHSQSTFYDTQPPAGGAGEASWPTPTGSPKTTTRVNQNANGVSRGFVYPSSRLDTAQGARSMNKKKCKKCGGRQKQGTKAPSQDVLKWRAGSPRTCNCCRPLDRCEHKILPWEFKFSHYNQGPKTLYHCDCTRRLAKQMKGEVNVNRLKELFFKFVSHNCFQLKMSSKNCNQEELVGCDNRSSSPMAVLFKPRYLQRFLKVQRTAEESLSPLPDGQEGNQNATFNSTNSVKLYDKCLQMIRALTVKP